MTTILLYDSSRKVDANYLLFWPLFYYLLSYSEEIEYYLILSIHTVFDIVHIDIIQHHHINLLNYCNQCFVTHLCDI